jgi:hypothetical protein
MPNSWRNDVAGPHGLAALERRAAEGKELTREEMPPRLLMPNPR